MIDKNSPIPIYIQIRDYLKNKIEEKKYSIGTMIPSETELSKSNSVSRMTVRHAINELVEMGYVIRKRGIGTFVAEKKLDLDIKYFEGFSRKAKREGKAVTNKVIQLEKLALDEFHAKKLDLELGELVYYSVRVRYLDGKPATIEYNYMPYKIFEDLDEEVLMRSKYEYIKEKKGLIIKESVREVEPSLASTEISNLLDLPRNTPVLKVNSTSYLDTGIPFEYTEIYYNPKYYKLIYKSEYL